jgi:hypothetical protein
VTTRPSPALTAALLLLLVSMSASMLALGPLALVGLLVAVAVVRRGLVGGAVAWATLVFVLLLLLNMAALVPGERLADLAHWRWHGRVLIAPLAMLMVLVCPFAPRAGTLRRGLAGMLAVMALVAVWGRAALLVEGLPRGVSLGGWSVEIISHIADRDWFHGLFRHHEVAGGAYALAALYALSVLVDGGRRPLRAGWTLLFLGNILGLILTVARAYYGGFLAGALVLGGATLALTPVDRRGVVWRRLVLAGLASLLLAASTPDVARRLAVVFRGPEATAEQPPAEDPAALDPAAEESVDVELGGAPLEAYESTAAPSGSLREGLSVLNEVPLFDERPGGVAQPPSASRDVARVEQFVALMPVERRTLWDRLVLWKAAWEGVRMRPWFGFGVGSFPIHYRGHAFMWSQANPEHHVHNNVLQVLVDAGLIGLLVVLAWAGLVVRGLARCARSPDGHAALALGCLAGIACLTAGGLLDNNLYAPTLMLPLVVPAALLLGGYRPVPDEPSPGSGSA